jgi:hypothetical protein
MTEPTPQPSRKAATPLDTRLIKKWLIWLTAVAVVYLAWNADRFYAYYQFKQLCKAEAGFEVFEKLEPGVGWTTNAWSEAMLYPWPKQIAFIRTKDRSGQPVDVVWTGTGAMPNGDDAYWGKPVDPTARVLYHLGWRHDGPAENELIGRSFKEVKMIETGSPIVRETRLTFGGPADPGNLLALFRPIRGDACPPLDLSTRDSFWKQVEQKAFKE